MGVISLSVTSNSVVALWLASPFLPILYTFLLISVRWWKPIWPARATDQARRAGCQAPTQATCRGGRRRPGLSTAAAEAAGSQRAAGSCSRHTGSAGQAAACRRAGGSAQPLGPAAAGPARGRSAAAGAAVRASGAAHLAQTTVGLPGQAGDAPAGDDALIALTLGDGDGIDHLVGLEDRVHGDGLLKQAAGKVHLGSHVAAVDLRGAGGRAGAAAG